MCPWKTEEVQSVVGEHGRRASPSFRFASARAASKFADCPAYWRVRLEVGKALITRKVAERKHLANVLNMVAYPAESALFRVVSPHYRRAQDEGRILIQCALASVADLGVTQDELRVTLAPLNSPRRTHAIAALCQSLKQTNTVFPGSPLRVRFAVRVDP